MGSGQGDYDVHIYQINPYLELAVEKVVSRKLPENWITGIEKLEIDYLESIDYFNLINRVKKIRKNFREILLRDLDELYINYIMNNKKAIITLSGSIMETVLLYYCKKKEIKQITYTINQKQCNKKLYEADLGDLLNYFEQNRLLNDILVHMGNISRISRNYIHPGKELRDSDELNQAKVELCFISVIEIIKSIC